MKINDIVIKVSFINPIKNIIEKCCFSIITIVDINEDFITTIHKITMFEITEIWNVHDNTNVNNSLNFICNLDTAINIYLNKLSVGIDRNLTYIS